MWKVRDAPRTWGTWVLTRRIIVLKLIGFLAVLAVIIVTVGLFFGWFSFSKASQGAGSAKATEITFNVNEGKIKADAEKVKAKTSDLVSSGKDALTSGRSVEGTLTQVEPTLRRLTLVQDEAGMVTVTVKDGAKIELNGAAVAVTDLKPSDRIIARCETAETGNVAISITATRK